MHKKMTTRIIIGVTIFIIVFCMCIALLVGCDESELDDPGFDLDDSAVLEKIFADALDVEYLQKRGALYYAPNQQAPYTGWVKDGNSALWQVEAGHQHGLFISWYKNGQKEKEGKFEDGSKEGLWTYWYENGQKEKEGKHKGDEIEGLWAFWLETGQKYNKLEKYSVSVEEVLSLAFSPDGRTLASGTGGSEGVRLWDTHTGEILKTLEEHLGVGASIAFSPDGTMLAGGGSVRFPFEYTLCLWDVRTGKLKDTLTGHTGTVTTVAFSPDGTMLASGSYDSEIRLWNAKTGAPLRRLGGHSHGVESVAFSPDGTTLASGGRDNMVRLWDADTGEILKTLEGHQARVNSVAFSPDGTMLASGGSAWLGFSDEKPLFLWDVRTGKLIKQLGAGRGFVSVAFSPDGTMLAANNSSRDATIVRLWDVGTWKAKQTYSLRKYRGGLEYISNIAFRSDGRILASVGSLDTIYLWHIP